MPGRRVELAGRRFGRLTVVRFSHRDRQGRAMWLCRCDCGRGKSIRGANLRSGQTNSCGCLRRELATKRTKHGHKPKAGASPTYASWKSMLRRCTNPKDADYKIYGGSDTPVRVCERWLVFANFLGDMGERPKGTTLGRFGDIGDYEPANCIWMRREEQGAERKKKNIVSDVMKNWSWEAIERRHAPAAMAA